MLRTRQVVLGAAALLPLGLVMLRPAAHAAGGVDATHYTITCDTLSKGTAGFVPSLRLPGGPMTETIKLKGTLSGCSATPDGSNPAVQVISGSVSGLLTGNTNSCTSLLGPTATTGTITIKWKTVPALLESATVITLTSGDVSGGTTTPFSPDTASYGLFTISGTTQTGPFSGPSGTGAASFTKALTVQGAVGLANTCASAHGLKSVNLGSTEFQGG